MERICWSMQKFKGFRFDPWVRKIPWRKKWQPTSVFLLGNFHGQSMGSQTIRHYWATDHACTHTWLQLLFRCLVVSDSLQPLGLQHARFPCPLLSLSLLKSMPIESFILSNHLILCCLLLLLPSIFPSIRDFPMSRLFASAAKVLELQL